jgi:hypothetical protein
MTYINEARLLLQAFEQTQSTMLFMKLQESVEEFEIELQNMYILFKETHLKLSSRKFYNDRDKTLLTKQIERLLKFLKEMTGHIDRIKTNPPPSEEQIILIFHRQHLFKNIYKKHLSDYIMIIS